MLFLGDISSGNSEWFWHFNQLFFQFLESKSLKPKHIKPSRKNSSGYGVRNLFGYEVSFNLNNLLIANPKTEKCILFTTFFDLRQLRGGLKNLPIDKIESVYSGHYDERIINRDWPEIIPKIKPWYFRPWKTNHLYQENCYKPKNDNIYFRGLMIPGIRNLLDHLSKSNIQGVDIQSTKSKNYHNELTSSRLAFSMSGIRDMCNRDVEYWLTGMPFIRPRFTSKLLIEIPDDTYIPIDWEPNYNSLTPIPQNIELLSQHIIEKYQSVKKDYNYLNKISRNGYNFYKSNFTMDLMIKNSFDLLLKSNII